MTARGDKVYAFKLIGGKGSYDAGPGVLTMHSGETVTRSLPPSTVEESFVDQLADFCAAVEQDTPSRINAQDGLNVLLVIEAALRSSNERRVVSLDELRG